MRAYRTQHFMLEYYFGKASEYPCAACDSPARDWAYTGAVGSHSDDYSDYIPLCRPCHKTHDAPTHCPSGHEYTNENTYRDKRNPNKRFCRACNRARYHRRKAC